MIYSILLFLMLCLSFVVQEFVPDIDWAYRATIMVVPLVFFSGAATVPYPYMLMLAFFTGFLWDARYVVPGGAGPSATADVSFGYSIFLYGVLGSLMQGIRPLFRRGRWELPVLFTGLATFLLLTFEYLIINFMRGGFYFPRDVWFKIVTTSLLTMAASPLLFFVLYRVAQSSGYRIRYEGLAYR
ncbi:hypothetical protein BH23VER1_BH23VER1_04140 [soil metagenome]